MCHHGRMTRNVTLRVEVLDEKRSATAVSHGGYCSDEASTGFNAVRWLVARPKAYLTAGIARTWWE